MAQSTRASNRIVIGIDLGTSNSCVGVWRNGRVEIVENDQGNRSTPSCVAFTDTERLIGEGANHQVATNASNTVFDVKRLMGRSSSDASVKSDAIYWPFGLFKGPDDRPLIRVSYLGREKEFSPEEISAMVLAKMKEIAEAYVGVGITSAVVTVPAYFNSSQRRATKDAAAIAGLNVMRIINEPTAAAIAYSLDRNWKDSTVLVYDLGGGTLDVSLVVVNKGVLEVKATAGDTHLGGEDFTNNMVDHFVIEFKKQSKRDISGDKKALGRLRRSCEEGKKRLSTNPRTPVDVEALFERVDFHSEITRDQFEQLNVELFRRCMEPVERCLAHAGMDKTKVDDVVLVGGSTRIPRVHQLLTEFFGGKELCRNINADEAVAYGATIHAGTLMDQTHPQVFDVTSFSQGIGMLEGVMLEVIPRNTRLLTTKVTTFFAVKDSQSSVEITVYEDGRAMANKFPIALNPKAEVACGVDQDGILQVWVWAQDKMCWIPFTNLVGRFSAEEMERMVDDAQKYKAHDEEHKKNVQARNDIQNLLFSISNNMKNLEDSVRRLLRHLQEPTTREQEKQTSGIIGCFINPIAQDKENKKMQQAHNDIIMKLPDRIKKLQETAEETSRWLENEDHTTITIIEQQKQIEDDYHRICKQIESVSRSKFNKLLPQNKMSN